MARRLFFEACSPTPVRAAALSGGGTVNLAINDQVGNDHFDRYTQEIVMPRCGSAPVFPVSLDVGHGLAPKSGPNGNSNRSQGEKVGVIATSN